MGSKNANYSRSADIDVFNAAPCIAIVSLDAQLPQNLPLPQGRVYYQVTILQEHISPDRRFIRFGDIEGDEIMGWKGIDDLCIHEVLLNIQDLETVPIINQKRYEVN